MKVLKQALESQKALMTEMQKQPAVGRDLLERNVFQKLAVEMPAYTAKVEEFPARMRSIE